MPGHRGTTRDYYKRLGLYDPVHNWCVPAKLKYDPETNWRVDENSLPKTIDQKNRGNQTTTLRYRGRDKIFHNSN
jgi:hypothetical protein